MAEKTLSLPVTGMTCANCVTTVERNVRKLEGVQEANVNFASERISLVYDDALLDTGDVISRIRKAGRRSLSKARRRSDRRANRAHRRRV